MRYPDEIRIHQLVIHLVDPHRNNVVISERDLPVDDAPRLLAYLRHHIRASLADPVASAARFRVLEAGSAFALCDQVLAGQGDLATGSGLVARKLEAIVRANRSISGGVLVACLYSDSGQPEIARFLALLKLDSSEVFRHTVARDERTGKPYIRLQLEGNILPTERERLQKCAFIRPRAPGSDEYDMLLLDRQVRAAAETPIARFFVEQLLGAELAPDPRSRTKRLYHALLAAHGELESELAPAIAETLRRAVDEAVACTEIDLDQWLAALPLTGEQRTTVERHLQGHQLLDRRFAIDVRYSHRTYLRKRVFRGDQRLKVELSGDPQDYARVVHSVERIEQPDRPAYFQVVLHTERWEEMPL